jgi:hypothetical protein
MKGLLHKELDPPISQGFEIIQNIIISFVFLEAINSLENK